MDEKDKKEYELAVLVKTEEDLTSVVALVRQHNGEMSAEPRAKKLALAYPIKGITEAIFAYGNFHALPSDAKELEHDLNIKPEVIRFLMIASPAPAESLDRERERQPMAPGAMPSQRRTRVMRPSSPSGAASDMKPSAPQPLSNEALEKKIEEILQ
jgi:ribosomal protein S6